MSFRSILQGLGSLMGESLVDEFSDRVEETLDSAKIKVEEIAERVVRRLIGFFLLLTGLVFSLVGLGKFLSENVDVLSDGIGYIVIGLILVLLAWFASYMGKK